MTQDLDKLSAAPYAPLLTFIWGSGPSVTRYCRWTESLQIGTHAFTPAPEMQITFDKALHGGAEDVPVKIRLRTRRRPADTLSEPFPHAPVRVLVEECNPLDAENTRREVYFGKVKEVESAMRGTHLLTTLEVSGIKAQLNFTVGIQALSTCINKFGDEQDSFCGEPLEPLRETGTILEVGLSRYPNRILTDLEGLESWQWKGGYVDVAGARVKIRRMFVNSSGTVFDLRAVPPSSWEGQTAVFTPGCDKTIEACRKWGREERFMGTGYGMPGGNPLISVKR